MENFRSNKIVATCRRLQKATRQSPDLWHIHSHSDLFPFRVSLSKTMKERLSRELLKRVAGNKKNRQEENKYHVRNFMGANVLWWLTIKKLISNLVSADSSSSRAKSSRLIVSGKREKRNKHRDSSEIGLRILELSYKIVLRLVEFSNSFSAFAKIKTISEHLGFPSAPVPLQMPTPASNKSNPCCTFCHTAWKRTPSSPFSTQSLRTESRFILQHFSFCFEFAEEKSSLGPVQRWCPRDFRNLKFKFSFVLTQLESTLLWFRQP